MAQVHVASAWLAVALAVVALVVAAAAAAGLGPSRRTLDRAILGLLAGLVVPAAIGIVLLLVGPPPSDPLHVLYGAVALAAVPLARYAGHDGDDRRLARFVAVGVVVALGALLRLFMTGR